MKYQPCKELKCRHFIKPALHNAKHLSLVSSAIKRKNFGILLIMEKKFMREVLKFDRSANSQYAVQSICKPTRQHTYNYG